MLEFGRACRATKNWRAGITLLVADAHFRIMSRMAQSERAKYMGSPEVWSEIESVYAGYLKHHPQNDVARSKYAAFRSLAGRSDDAHAQFQVPVDRLSVWPTTPNIKPELLKRVREEAVRKAGKPRETGDSGKTPG